MFASSRARCAPRQKCTPPPKLAIFWELLRPIRNVVGVVEHLGVAIGGADEQEHLVAGAGWWRRAGRCPLPRCARRVWLDVSYRSVSSTHSGARSGSDSTRRTSVLLRAPQNSALPSSFVVVSLPATTIRNMNPMISSSDSRSPSISASSSAEVRSSVSFARRSAIISCVVADEIQATRPSRRRGTSRTPSSRCTTRSASRRISARSDFGNAHEFGDHVHRQLAGDLGDPVELPCRQARVRGIRG